MSGINSVRMKVLVAEDERITRRIIESMLDPVRYEVVSVDNGEDAWALLQAPDAPSLALLDWSMPGMDGTEVCRLLRAERARRYTYTIIVTARTSKQDVVEGLSAGADDFISKPIDADEFRARIRTGERILHLEHSLATQISELRAAQEHITELHGLLPVCMHCKRVRNTDQLWERMETYLERYNGIRVSHGLCDSCLHEHYHDDENTPA